MDLHVRGVSPSNRPTSTSRSQPIRLQPSRPAAAPEPEAVEVVRTFQPIVRSRSGAFAYEQGAISLAGQAEADGDGAPRVAGQAKFAQGRLQLESEGTFTVGYEGPETVLEGEGDFTWQDGRGMPISGRGRIAVRQDDVGNALIRLEGSVRTRHQSIAIQGPAEAEIDARANGSFVVRLNGKARFGTALATVDGSLDLTYGEVDGERLNAVQIHGRGQTFTEYLSTDGDGHLKRQMAYGGSGMVLNVHGPGTYRHGNLVCEGDIHLRIIPHGTSEAYDGTITGFGQYSDDMVGAAGDITGQFFQVGERHDFSGTLTGEITAAAGDVRGEGSGAMTLTLTSTTSAWEANLTGQTGWQAPGVALIATETTWKRDEQVGMTIHGDADLRLDTGPWHGGLSGPLRIVATADDLQVTQNGTMMGVAPGYVILAGPGSATCDQGWWRIDTTLGEAADVEGLPMACQTPVTLESGTLPNGQPFWYCHVGGPMRHVTISATAKTESPEAIVARVRVVDGDKSSQRLETWSLAELQASADDSADPQAALDLPAES